MSVPLGGAGPDTEVVAAELRTRLPFLAKTAIVLGSGLGSLVERLEDVHSVSFNQLSGMPSPGVFGHAGRFVAARLGGVEVLVQAGRYHAYEGHAMAVVAAPVRIAAALGVDTLIVTNAAGALDPSLAPGDLVLLEDHINFTFDSPLRGPQRSGEERFPDMSRPYDPELRRLARAAAEALGIGLRDGVYVGVPGPAFETAAEVRMLELIGGHVVGMSTVPEVLVARALGLRCLGFSMVANLGTGLSTQPIEHEEVLRVGREAGGRLGRVLEHLLGSMGAAAHSTGAK